MPLFWKSQGQYSFEQNIRKRPDFPTTFMGISADVLT
jgi:hypothetical protein